MAWRILVVIAVAVAGCGESAKSPAAPQPPAAPRLSTALASGCFNWPAVEFSSANKATVRTLLAPGSMAVEFTLQDLNGARYSLSSLLATRPVLIVHGSFT